MSDPLQHLDGHRDLSELKFAKLHSPKMKSVYWQHFGFPTNENDRIITKQNVVCTLCRKVLTNHGNTTNLRAHLQHRHKEIFHKICAENGIKVPPRKPTQKNTNVTILKSVPEVERKFKIEFQDVKNESSNQNSMVAEDQALLYESMVPMTYEDDDVIDADHFAKVEVTGGLTVLKSPGSSEVEVSCDAKSNYRMNVIEEMDPYQLQDALVNMVVQDMRNVDSLYDPGMTQFVRTLSGNIVIPPEKKIEALIKELHSDKLTMLADQIKVHSQVKPYSLGFEIWANVEHKSFISIYYNYTTDAPDYNLLNQLYCSIEYNKFTVIDSFFDDFNLLNCTAAITNYDYDDYLRNFLQTKNIPIILAYDVTVDKCLRNVFALPTVVTIIEEVKEVIMRYTTEINSKDIETPLINDDFPWTYYELLKFFSETVSWPDDVDVLVNSVRIIKDTLNTLAITLDTLKGEEIPHSSMLSPITAKILTKKLAVTTVDDDFVAMIKSTVSEELQKLVIADDHLTISALLDPRFHRLTNITNLGNCLQILTDKYKKITELEGYTALAVRDSDGKSAISTTKKSNLELFFDIQENSNPAVVSEECSVDADLKRYRNEVYVSLDESPFLWWNKVGHVYGSLKHLAYRYQCVPCVVNMNFRKPVREQIYEQQKRYMLSGSLIDAILFLHHHQQKSNT